VPPANGAWGRNFAVEGTGVSKFIDDVRVIVIYRGSNGGFGFRPYTMTVGPVLTSSTLAVSPAHSFINLTNAVAGITTATPNAVGMKIDATYYGVSATYKIRSVQ